MELWILLSVLFLLILIVLLSLLRAYLTLKTQYNELLLSKRSQAVRHGLSFEQLFPFANNYPYDTRNFRFIGTPVDGISFEPDSVVFIEFKTGSSKLSEPQKRIKQLVQSKNIDWKEITD